MEISKEEYAKLVETQIRVKLLEEKIRESKYISVNEALNILGLEPLKEKETTENIF